jgi:hypothetical protein
MPDDFYKIGPLGYRHFDELGLRALERDWTAWPGQSSSDLMERSQFNLFHDIGIHVFRGNRRQALDYAMGFLARVERVAPVIRGLDPQSYLALSIKCSPVERRTVPS